MEKIRLSNILDKHLEAAYIISGEKISDKYITPLHACMQEVWNLAVDKCVENATVAIVDTEYGFDYQSRTAIYGVDKDSILEVKEMIK